MSTVALPVVGVGELADALRCQGYKLRVLWREGVVPEPPKLAGRTRLVPLEQIPQILLAFEARGWLSGQKFQDVKQDLVELGWLQAEEQQHAVGGDGEYADESHS